MNGIHDLGGMQDMGDLPFEANEPVFHADWERQVLGVNVVLNRLGAYTVHELRYSIERIPPLDYLGSPYFLHWLDGIERLLVEKDYVTKEELASGRASSPLPQGRRPGADPPHGPGT